MSDHAVAVTPGAGGDDEYDESWKPAPAGAFCELCLAEGRRRAAAVIYMRAYHRRARQTVFDAHVICLNCAAVMGFTPALLTPPTAYPGVTTLYGLAVQARKRRRVADALLLTLVCLATWPLLGIFSYLTETVTPLWLLLGRGLLTLYAMLYVLGPVGRSHGR